MSDFVLFLIWLAAIVVAFFVGVNMGMDVGTIHGQQRKALVDDTGRWVYFPATGEKWFKFGYKQIEKEGVK